MYVGVNLTFYEVEELTGLKKKIESAYAFGNLFKGDQAKVPIAIFNEGDAEAVSPVATIQEYVATNGDFSECFKWKKISMSKSMGFETSVRLPNIQPDTWMTGRDVFTEDFSKYPPDIGASPDQDWLLWGGSSTGKIWEIYSGYLQHNVDTVNGRACWATLPSAKDFTFSTKITVRDGVWAGYILRDTGDYNTGYIVLIQGVSTYFPVGMPQGEGVIQVYKGRFTDGVSKWELLYQSNSIGVRATHDPFKVRLVGNRFDFWYKDIENPNPMYSFIDENNTYENASKPILCTHAGGGNTLIYFDDIKMEVENDFGLLWIENNVDPKTGLFGTQYSILDVSYGGVK